MAYNYTTYQSYLATMMATTTADTYFQTILPMCIDYAEQRIYRELDLLNTRARDSSIACTPGTRLVTLVSTLVVLETLAAITPAGSTPSAGKRNVLIPVTHDYIDLVYPNESGSTYQDLPKFYAMLTAQGVNSGGANVGASVLLGPSPDQAYVLESVGTFRPAPLTALNANTVLTALLPDLFMAASMIFMSGFQKNFGAQADDPKMSQSWESQYQTLMMSAKTEEFRKKYEASSWSSMIRPETADKARG